MRLRSSYEDKCRIDTRLYDMAWCNESFVEWNEMKNYDVVRNFVCAV